MLKTIINVDQVIVYYLGICHCIYLNLSKTCIVEYWEKFLDLPWQMSIDAMSEVNISLIVVDLSCRISMWNQYFSSTIWVYPLGVVSHTAYWKANRGLIQFVRNLILADVNLLLFQLWQEPQTTSQRAATTNIILANLL